MDKNRKVTYVFSDEQLLFYNFQYSVKGWLFGDVMFQQKVEGNDSLINFPKLIRKKNKMEIVTILVYLGNIKSKPRLTFVESFWATLRQLSLWRILSFEPLPKILGLPLTLENYTQRIKPQFFTAGCR